jgi:hypothetical protein
LRFRVRALSSCAQYVSGAPGTLDLKDASGEVVESLRHECCSSARAIERSVTTAWYARRVCSVGKWKTEHIVEFLREKLVEVL